MKDQATGPVFRYEVLAEDVRAVRRMVESTGFFRPDEADIAVELVEEQLAKGDASGYFFVFAQLDKHVAGYACYGPIACTIGSYDLYWIAVDRPYQGRGLGRRLLAETERLIAARGGRRIYIETSGRLQYLPTRSFYERCGYHTAAVLSDFYDRGDDKVVLVKPMDTTPATR